MVRQQTGEASSALFVCFGIIVVVVTLFLIGWRMVFVNNLLHRLYDWMMEKFSEMVQGAIALRNRGQDAAGNSEDATDTGKTVLSTLGDPKIRKYLPQGIKIIIAYFQVMQSFFNFRLEWPDTITNAITIFRSVATIVAFDLMAWPGVGCLVVIEYESKLYLRTMLPALIGLMMGVPVLFAKLRKYHAKKRGASKKERLAIKENLLDTQNSFWNNILTWLFLVYPTTSLASMEVIQCINVLKSKYIYKIT